MFFLIELLKNAVRDRKESLIILTFTSMQRLLVADRIKGMRGRSGKADAAKPPRTGASPMRAGVRREREAGASLRKGRKSGRKSERTQSLRYHIRITLRRITNWLISVTTTKSTAPTSAAGSMLPSSICGNKASMIRM